MGDAVVDMAGKRFGRWTVVERAGTSGGSTRAATWRCVCECGAEAVVVGTRLRRGRSRGCPSCASRGLRPGDAHDPAAPARARRLREYLRGAGARGREWSLTDAQFEELITSDCFYCGAPPVEIPARKGHFKFPGSAGGIDRIDSSKGYTIDNCRPCCSSCNYMKSADSDLKFLENVFRIAGRFAALHKENKHVLT
jgi:hypothetical protein